MKIKSVKTKKNSILKEFIIEKYGSISKFTKKEKVPRGDIEVILHKDDIFNEINIGMKVCKALDIDAEELFCRGNIRTSDSLDSSEEHSNGIGNDNISIIVQENLMSDEIVREKCLKLGGSEQRKILDYINSILDN